MDLSKIDSLVVQVERGERTLTESDKIASIMQWFYSKLYKRQYTMAETLEYLTASINQYSINYSLDIQNAIEQYEAENEQKP